MCWVCFVTRTAWFVSTFNIDRCHLSSIFNFMFLLLMNASKAVNESPAVNYYIQVNQKTDCTFLYTKRILWCLWVSAHSHACLAFSFIFFFQLSTFKRFKTLQLSIPHRTFTSEASHTHTHTKRQVKCDPAVLNIVDLLFFNIGLSIISDIFCSLDKFP